MKKSEKLKCFLLANVLTLFFALAPAASAISNPFDSNLGNVHDKPFSKLIEFLNAKKNELEKHNGGFRSEKIFSENNNSDSASLPALPAGQAGKADSAGEFNPGVFPFWPVFWGASKTP